MTGMPTGEVEVDSAEGAEVDEVADGTAAADACWSTAVGDSPGGEVSVEAWSRSPAGGGDPGAASVMTPILGGEPGWTLLRRKEPRGGVIFLMSAALWNEAVMGVLGGWILLVTLVVTIVGVPWAWWIMSVAGGGGMLVAAVVAAAAESKRGA